MNEDYRAGKIYAFSIIIATLCGLQNTLGCNESSPEYQAYQKILLLTKKELADTEEKIEH